MIGMKSKKSRNMKEYAGLLILAVIAFITPLLIGHPAEAVGIIVNAVLVLGAIKLDKIRIIPVIILPGIGVLARGIVFGPMAPFLPIVVLLAWIGNAILVLFIRMKVDRILGTAAGAIAKTAFMATAASFLVFLKVLPPPVLATMGFFQLYTAAIGGAAVILADKGIKRTISKRARSKRG